MADEKPNDRPTDEKAKAPRAENEGREAGLIERARRAFGLGEGEIMAAVVKGLVVTLVTIGAHKVRWKPGDEVRPLHDLHAGRSIKPTPPAGT